MTPLAIIALFEFVAVVILLYILVGALNSADLADDEICELENQRDAWKKHWRFMTDLYINQVSKRAIESDDHRRLKAENESLVASVNYWKNATNCEKCIRCLRATMSASAGRMSRSSAWK